VVELNGEDHCQRITSSMAVVVVVVTVIAIVVVVSVMPTAFVYAQTTTMTEEELTGNATTQLITPSATAQQIINTTKAECEAANFFQPRCVNLVYESPTTVVVKGLVVIFGGSPETESRAFHPNPFLWKTVDAFKAQGYIITDIEVTVLGNESTNSEFIVIMSK
jgi:hypothetical protein